jgi:hypothetical protein
MSLWQAAFNLGAVRLRRAARQWRAISRGSQRASRTVARVVEQASQAPGLARARLERGRALLDRTRRRVARLEDHVFLPMRTEQAVTRALAKTAAGGRPIIVGPWTSEVGYEALYWVPFVQWAADRYRVAPDRVVVLSRGGTHGWYRRVAGQYVEIFELVDPDEFAAQAAFRRDRGDQKQMLQSDLDRELLRLASRRLGIRDAAVWHPGLMYQVFRAFWYGDRSLDFFLRHSDFRYPQIDPSADLDLPAEYAAVKFYTGPALPDTVDNRAALHRLVSELASERPVVVLDTAWSTDEHRDYSFDSIPGVRTLKPSLDPRTNLGRQTQVIAGARRFVGTCGGLAWLAPFLGVDTVAVYENDRYLTAHLYAARYAYRRYGAARFSTLNLQAARGIAAAS